MRYVSEADHQLVEELDLDRELAAFHPLLQRSDAFLEQHIGECAGGITRAAHQDGIIDPVARLLDPAFTEPLWEYEYSQIDPNVPGVLHDKQLDVLRSNAIHRWLFWGNQTGKTTIGAVACALLALGRMEEVEKLLELPAGSLHRWSPPVVIWASALTWELWENVLLPELLTWLPKERILDAPEPYSKSTKRVIRVLADNGKVSRIEGKSAEQGASKYQSRRLHFVWFDEEHPEGIFDEVLPRLLRHGGMTMTTATPLKGLTWIYDRIYRPWKEGQADSSAHWCSHAGISDNPGIESEQVEALKRELRHNPALLAARLEGKFMRPQGLVVHNFDLIRHTSEVDERSLEAMMTRGQLYGAVDFGFWRFAFGLGLVDRAGVMTLVEEIFSQVATLEDRARQIHDYLVGIRAPARIPIWGDAANPQDILEINQAFMRLNSQYRVMPVAMENKIRKVGAERIRSLFDRGVLRVRRSLAKGRVWRLGAGAGRLGVPVEGSRLLWELNNWSYPKQKDGKEQLDDPDDSSADGGDMMAMLRYLVMSWWKAPDYEVPPPSSAWDKRVLELESERLRRGEVPPGKTRRGRHVRRRRYA